MSTPVNRVDVGSESAIAQPMNKNYIPVKCYLCNEVDNPKRMISLSGSTKNRHKEVAYLFKRIDNRADNIDDADVVDINSSRLCKHCTQRVIKEINGCFICGKIVADARLVREISDGRFKELAMEERLSFQSRSSMEQPTESDRCCLSCQKRINGIINEEKAGNTMKMKVVLQRSKQACIVCLESTNLQDLSRNVRINTFIQTGLFIIQGSKICQHHLIGEKIIPSLCEGLIAVDRQIVIHASEVCHWLNALRFEIIRPKKKQYDDVDSFEECDLVALTSLTKGDFQNLFSFLHSYRDTDGSKCHRVDLLCFLSKMRQGLSDDFLRAIFGYSTRQSVSLAVSRVRKGLVQTFVPKYLGVKAISRDELIEAHVPEYAQILYNPSSEKKAVLIIDGTYMYIPKSTNYRVLRQSFCMHKGAHLVKPVMVVTPDGWILDVHGPYFSDGKNNDAECLRDAMKDVDGLKDYLKASDILLVDKGYDRVVKHLQEDHSLSVFMPKFLEKGEKQYTTDEANSTRLVTASRWVVESRNGHLKSKFGLFRSTIPMQHVKHIGDFVRIACAIINAYCPPITMAHASAEWARNMIDQSKKQNKLRQYVDEKKLQGQRKNWEIMTALSLPEFPKLTYDYLRKITFGVYQIKLARSYVQDKIQHDNQFNFKIHKERPGFIRVQTKSRFSGSKHRNLWVLYKDPLLEFDNELYDENDDGPILGWCCDCPNGNRSLGCCAHVVSVLWYLGVARHTQNAFPSNELLSAIKDCAQRPTPVISLNGLTSPTSGDKYEDMSETIEVDIENGQFYFDEGEPEEFDIQDSVILLEDVEPGDFFDTANVTEI